MELEFSKKSKAIQGGIFNVLNDRKKELINQGKKVYNFSIGTPDFQPAPHIMEAMEEACKDPRNYKYAIDDNPIYPEDNYVLKFENIPEEIARKAKLIVVSYPLNPVCAVADDEFYKELIAFAKKYHMMVLKQ